jgi:hypothetical protein
MINSRRLNSRATGLNAGFTTSLLLLAAALNMPSASAQQVGASRQLFYQPGVVADVCTIISADGSLGASQNRQTISSSISELTQPILGSPVGASITVESNLDNQARLIADAPVLRGPTSADRSEVSIGGGTFAAISSQNLNPDGTLATDVHVRFSSSSFSNGIYDATAIVTCSRS